MAAGGSPMIPVARLEPEVAEVVAAAEVAGGSWTVPRRQIRLLALMAA